MKITRDDYLIKDKNKSIKINNIEDVFLKNFDITWANSDSENNIPNGGITEKNFQHKIGHKIWDILPIEDFFCEHNSCDDSIIYNYNNEYFRSDDFTNQHEGLHVLFAGCSETEGVGGSLESTWSKRVYNEISKSNKMSGFYSIARAGYGWQKIITNFQIYSNKYGFPEFLFILLPNIGRQYRYELDTQTYRYYQLYPEPYEVNENVSLNNMHKQGIILLEEYYKTLLDFKISWEMFEKFCKANGTNILWSTYNLIDAQNINSLNIGDKFFDINVEKVDNYINNKNNILIKKDSFVYRDGHNGSLIKEYWAEMFLEEIRNRKMISI